jgi:hypothetical protein
MPPDSDRADGRAQPARKAALEVALSRLTAEAEVREYDPPE